MTQLIKHFRYKKWVLALTDNNQVVEIKQCDNTNEAMELCYQLNEPLGVETTVATHID